MSTHVEFCAAMAEKEGWAAGPALQGMILDPKSGTATGFRQVLANANEIRSLMGVIGPTMKAMGYDVEGALYDFVAKGLTPAAVREDTLRVMAEHDEATAVDTTRRTQPAGSSDPYQARAAEIDAHKGKTK